ncbi:MAG: diaminopimelate decarboxylase [Chloroflexi bacterium]|nr:diaminopimelate decarboxylase [Chloroflexota bacterium]
MYSTVALFLDMLLTNHSHELCCEEVPLGRLAAEYGTPLYVYSHAELSGRARTYLAGTAHAHYAIKANANLHLLRLLASHGMGADVTSGGELYLALKAGFAPQQIIFSGVGKTAAEIRQALTADIQAIHVESPAELELVAHIAAEFGRPAPIGVRLNPNINAETHPYISTGMSEHKFGISMAEGLPLLRHAHTSPHLTPVGIAAHIGSQIRDLAPFREAAVLLADVAAELRTAGLPLRYIDVGGGLGIDYHADGRGAPSIEEWLAAVSAPVNEAGFELVVEPGRSIIGPAGLLLTQLIRTKTQGEKHFAIVDAGMSDLIRPTLYQAYHELVWVGGGAGEQHSALSTQHPALLTYDVVGPICETGDFLGRGRVLPRLAEGDLLAVLNAGAYGYAMSSNYNSRLRPAEVLVQGDQATLIRKRQVWDDLG